MLKRFFAVALLLSATPAHAADWEGVYEGTLGKAKVIVELVEPLDDMEGETKRETSRYSYLPKARDLNLMLASMRRRFSPMNSPARRTRRSPGIGRFRYPEKKPRAPGHRLMARRNCRLHSDGFPIFPKARPIPI
jgi:hypothetical protein